MAAFKQRRASSSRHPSGVRGRSARVEAPQPSGTVRYSSSPITFSLRNQDTVTESVIFIHEVTGLDLDTLAFAQSVRA